MKRSRLSYDPARAAERRKRREARREQDGPRPEDTAREARRKARETPASAVVAEDREQASAWHRYFAKQPCVMCAAHPLPDEVRRERAWNLATIDGHHIIPKQDLKRWELFAALWDLRNGMPLCRLHHFRHENAYDRVPRHLLPAAVFVFADEIGARSVLEDDAVYPTTN